MLVFTADLEPMDFSTAGLPEPAGQVDLDFLVVRGTVLPLSLEVALSPTEATCVSASE